MLAGAACVIAVAVGAIVVARVVQQREMTRRQAEEAASLDRLEAEQARLDADFERLGRTNRNGDRLEEGLASTDRRKQCDAALAIGRTNRTEFAGRLHRMLQHSSNDALTICLANGLIGLGEIEAPLRLAEDWAVGGDPDRLRAAVGIFGEIGPPAADVALPWAAAELGHPQAEARINAAYALTRLGPKARDLLERAAHDVDPRVRDMARKGLERLDRPS